jgi:NAD+ kinase
MKIGIIADDNTKAGYLFDKIQKKYSFIDITKKKSSIDVLVILGGDGFMLHTIHKFMDQKIKFYGINCGTLGFLLNDFSKNDLVKNIQSSQNTIIHPLQMSAVTADNKTHNFLAINEVSLLRETRQSANIAIEIDGSVKVNNLIGDGLLVASAAGSGAYNFSVKGPIFPLSSDLLALTPISPFRPRQWRGALLPGKTNFKFTINDSVKRPVSAVADFHEVRDVKEVNVIQDQSKEITLLFDQDNGLEVKLLEEQFVFSH